MQRRRKPQHWLAQMIVQDSNCTQSCRRTNPVPSALLNASLGSKSLGQKAPLVGGLGTRNFLRGENSLQHLSPWRSHGAQAGDGNDIGADTEDHSPSIAAARIRAFISLTASRRPTKNGTTDNGMSNIQFANTIQQQPVERCNSSGHARR